MPLTFDSEISRISDLERDILKALSDEDTQRLSDLIGVAKDINMTVRLLKTGTIARTMQKVRTYHDNGVAQLAKEVVREWKCVFSREKGTDKQHPTNFSTMNLEDFLTLDLHISRMKDRQYAEQQSCHASRVQILKKPTSPISGGRVVYWMSRDQRLNDNWALLKAQELAIQSSSPLAIVFSLTSSFPGANLRSYGFMLRGLKMLQIDAEHFNIPFFILKGSPEETIPEFCRSNHITTLVTDFSPLRISKQWKENIKLDLDSTTTFLEVDAHNVCPCWAVSKKGEFSAKTIRGKIHGLIDEFLHEYPALRVHPSASDSSIDVTDESGDDGVQWIVNGREYTGSLGGNKDVWNGEVRGATDTGGILQYIHNVDKSVPEVTWLESGERAAMQALKDFLFSSGDTTTNSRLERYSDDRNNPCLREGASNLSPYIHFGQLSTQRIILEVKRSRGFRSNRALFPEGERTTGVHSFCEELVVRKELSDNFCLYNPQYDVIEGAHNWAQTTLRERWSDPRAVVYSEEALEAGRTGDDLWNAAQLEMVHRGKMHGFMRMYWAKKILEWTDNPSEALRIAIYLNDKYSLDGRDPNGYVGCMWAIAGVHDRAWGPERQVFGKIRFMNYDGCKRKFDIKKYIAMQGSQPFSQGGGSLGANKSKRSVANMLQASSSENGTTGKKKSQPVTSTSSSLTPKSSNKSTKK